MSKMIDVNCPNCGKVNQVSIFHASSACCTTCGRYLDPDRPRAPRQPIPKHAKAWFLGEASLPPPSAASEPTTPSPSPPATPSHPIVSHQPARHPIPHQAPQPASQPMPPGSPHPYPLPQPPLVGPLITPPPSILSPSQPTASRTLGEGASWVSIIGECLFWLGVVFCILLPFLNSVSLRVTAPLLFVFVIFKIAMERAAARAKAQRRYQEGLAQLRIDPTNAELRMDVLERGRHLSRLCRQGGKETIFDEAALANDLNAACAGASRVAAPSAGPSVEHRLKQLSNMLQNGAITQEEYARQRGTILSSL